MQTITFNAPQSWNTYLFYGDHSGLSQDEQDECDAIVDNFVCQYGSCHVCEISDPDVYGNCTYTFLV